MAFRIARIRKPCWCARSEESPGLPTDWPSLLSFSYGGEEDVHDVSRRSPDQDGLSAVGPHGEGCRPDRGRADVVPEVRSDVDRSRAPIRGHGADRDGIPEGSPAVLRADEHRVDERVRRPDPAESAPDCDVA